MVALRQVELTFYRGIGRQRGRSFSALARIFGRTAFPFMRKYIVSAAESVGAERLKFALPEIADVVSCPKKVKTASNSVGRRSLRKQLGSGSRSKQNHSNRICKTTRRSRRDLFTNSSH